MTTYIENVNAYLSHMKMKQAYISLKSGIDGKKLSRILTGAQDVTSGDMEKISKALGKSTAYFLQEPFVLPEKISPKKEKVAFYVGNPTEEQEEFARKLVDFMENIDEIMSAKERFLNIAGK